MDQFISGMDTSGRSILSNTSGIIEITNADGVTNSNIVIRSLENQYRVGFYVPTVLVNGNEERTEAFVVYRKFYICCSSSVEYATVFSYGANGFFTL